MSQLTNGIAIWSDIKQNLDSSAPDSNYAPTKTEILEYPSIWINNAETYADNQCVKYDDLYKNVIYGDPEINLSYDIIPASGGTVFPTLSYSQSWGYGQPSGGGVITSGATIQYSGTNVAENGSVQALSKEDVVSEQTIITTVTVTVTMNGKTATKSVQIYQQANEVTAGPNQVSISISSDSISAAGGCANISSSAYYYNTYTSGAQVQVNNSQAISYRITSGDSDWYISGNQICVSANESTSSRSCTVEAYTSDGSASDSISQSEDSVYTYNYGNVSFSLSSADTVPASGGCVSSTGWSASQTVTTYWVSGDTTTNTYEGSSSNPNGFSVSFGNQVCGVDLGSTLTSTSLIGTLTATCTGRGRKRASDSVSVYQQANSIIRTTYGDVSVSISNVPDIPASGGSINSADVSYSQTVTYTYSSGTSSDTTITSGGSISWDGVTAASKGTTESSRTKAGTLKCTVTLNGKSGSDTADVYQEENKREKHEESRSGANVDVPSGLGQLLGPGTNSVGGHVPYTTIRYLSSTKYTYTSGESKTVGAATKYVEATTAYATSGSFFQAQGDINGFDFVVTNANNTTSIRHSSTTITVSNGDLSASYSFDVDQSARIERGSISISHSYSGNGYFNLSASSRLPTSVSVSIVYTLRGINGTYSISGTIPAHYANSETPSISGDHQALLYDSTIVSISPSTYFDSFTGEYWSFTY